jgi:hypothetical protein
MNRLGVVLPVVLVAACSFPEKHGGVPGDGKAGDSGTGDSRVKMDGQQGGDGGAPFGCIGQSFPTSAPPQIAFMGSAISQTLNTQGAPIAGVSTQLYSQASGGLLVNSTTDANGNFNFSAQTQNVAIDGYLELTAPSGQPYLHTYFFPRQPFHADQTGLLIGMYDQQTMQAIYQAVGVPYTPAVETMLVQVVDCNGAAVANAQVVPGPGTPPPGAIKYILANGTLDPSATMTDQAGTAIVLGVMQNMPRYTATNSDGQFHVYTYPYQASSVIYAVIQP